MGLYHLIYQSQALTALTLPELVELLEKSRAYNSCHGLTGILLHAPNGQFLQVLEGDSAAVLHLYHDRIAADLRHEHLVVLSEGYSEDQIFSDWCMSFRADASLLDLHSYLAPDEACARAGNLARASPELRRLLLDFAACCDDVAISESLMDSKL